MTTMRTMLGKLKRRGASGLEGLIVGTPMPLAVQTWAIKWLLPMDPWPKSLAYQQCLANRILRRHGAISQGGPFRGMVCIRDAREGCLVPKLLGCYEEELAPTIEDFVRGGYDHIIDVGCASGYYLVGLSLRLPRAEAFGFDIDEAAIMRCSRLIALNKLESRVKLGGRCTPAGLEEIISGRTFLMMDCEGGEYDLLDPKLAPALRRCDMIVEVHDFIDPRISSTLQERFKETHKIEKIVSRKREPSLGRYPGLDALPQKYWPAALDERRWRVMEWMVMRSRELTLET